MKRAILVAAAAIILSAVVTVSVAQTKKVVRKNGAPLIGSVTAKDDAYEVRTKSGLVTVPAADVISITDYVSFEEEYAKRLLALSSKDVQGRYKLALWCYKQEKLDQARDEFRKVLKLEPNHENAKLYVQLIEEELADRERPAPDKKPAVRPNGAKSATGAMIGEQDIYRVRLAELRSSDKVSIQFRKRVVERFIERMRGRSPFDEAGYEQVFRRKASVAKAVDMLDLLPDASDLHADIIVRTNPRFMSMFKTRIWPMLRQCASSQCHGSKEGAGRLKLYNTRSKADPLFFTNFLILDAFQNNQGSMIDRAHPAKSLLLQYGLPLDISATPHPVDIPAIFRNNKSDRRYTQVYDWIRADLLLPHPEYNLDYRIPGYRPPPKKKLFDEPAPADGDADAPAAPAGE